MPAANRSTIRRDAVNEIQNLTKNEKPLSERAADQIQKYIIEQKLSIGAKLPNEFELGEQLNVGRGTIREAVKLLVSRNVLEIQRGRGTYVANNTGVVDDPLGFAYMEDQKRLVRELFEIRMQMEPWIAERAAIQATEEQLQEVERWQAETEKLIEKDQNYIPADQKFHTSIAACTDNQVLTMLMPIITYSVHLFGLMNEVRLLQETAETHRQIVRALRDHDPEAARLAMVQHLMINQDTVADP